MNNPFAAIVQMALSGGNPMGLLGQMAQNNPQAAQALQMVSGKNSDQLQQMAANMCRERGTTPEQVLQSLGINIPAQR